VLRQQTHESRRQIFESGGEIHVLRQQTHESRRQIFESGGEIRDSIFADLAAHKTSEVLACSPVKSVNVVDFGSLTTLAKNAKIES
jgi:hypothetical protein